MLRELITALENWNINKSERQKLQYAYIIISMILIFAAGIISLINTDLGHDIVLFGFAAIVIFFVNGVVWNLLDSTLLRKLSTKPKRK